MVDFDRDGFLINFTYNTNKIEGSKLSFEDVKNIIQNKKYPDGASYEDIGECLGLYSTMSGLIDDLSLEITPDLISGIHYKIFSNSKSFAGKFRESPDERVAIFAGSGKIVGTTTPPFAVRGEIESLCKSHATNKDDIYEPFKFHIRFEKIHPFLDGNGRVGRVLLNYMLLKQGRNPIDIEYKDRATYYDFFSVDIQDGVQEFKDFYDEHYWK